MAPLSAATRAVHRHRDTDNRHRHRKKDNRHNHTDSRHSHTDNRHWHTDNRHWHTDNRHWHTDNRHWHTDNGHRTLTITPLKVSPKAVSQSGENRFENTGSSRSSSTDLGGGRERGEESKEREGEER